MENAQQYVKDSANVILRDVYLLEIFPHQMPFGDGEQIERFAFESRESANVFVDWYMAQHAECRKIFCITELPHIIKLPF